jgi:hypothetical protein
MNPTDDNPSRIDEHLFDLLVDDELSEQQRRQLLASLDDTPDGWRRCALAFLEAQCLGRELSRISRLRPTESRGEKRSVGGVAFGTHWRTLVAMAASFLVALGLGISWRSLFVPDRDFVSPSVDVAESGAPADGAVLDGLPEESSMAVSGASADPLQSSDSWRMVSFPVSNGSDGVEMIRLPAIERDSIDEAWLTNLPQGMPTEVVRAIEDSGHRVRGQRRLLPLRMKDGRRLVVPVDQVELQYVGESVYH